MKFIKTTILLFLLCAASFNANAQKIFSVDYESQADVKVFVVDYESQADLKVFKVKYESQAGKNDGRWFFVKYASQSDKKIFFVKYESQADVKVFFVDYESQAGWEQSSKMPYFFWWFLFSNGVKPFVVVFVKSKSKSLNLAIRLD